jgi:hypothetical protein
MPDALISVRCGHTAEDLSVKLMVGALKPEIGTPSKAALLVRLVLFFFDIQ